MITIFSNDPDKPGAVLPEGVVATVGFFDGVHSGHRFLIEQLKTIAGKKNLPSAAITFPVHPRKVLQSDFQPDLLSDFQEKLFQLSGSGVDYCFVIDFTIKLSQLTAKEFIQDILFQKLHVKTLLVGYDHRFGKNRSEGLDSYIMYGEECGMSVIKAESLSYKNAYVSSTMIRNLLLDGKIKKANKILTYHYYLEGTVIDGDKLGRKIGFPTANLELLEKNKLIPKTGIYAVWVHFNNTRHKGMLYIGERPTVSSSNTGLRIEVNLLNFNKNLYGKKLTVEFIEYLRDDMKFDDLNQLVEQLEKDREMTEHILRVEN